MREERKVCPLCEAMQARFVDTTWECVLADAWAGTGVETEFDHLQHLNSELERAEAEYQEARADLVRDYQEHYPS